MAFIKRILLILLLVLTTFSCPQIKAQEVLLVNNSVISAPKSLEKDFINAKENEISISAVNNSNSQIFNRRNNDNQTGSVDNHFIIFQKKFNNLTNYIHNQAYLEDKNELALLLLLHQIQPNAP